MRRFWRVLLALVGAAAVILVSVLAALVIAKRVRTGHWTRPEASDVAALRDGMVRIKNRLVGGAPGPSRVVYLERGKITLRAGPDDAARGVSRIIAAGRLERVASPGFSGSRRRWRQIVACVKKQFAPFDVEVTDRRPEGDDFILAVVAGRPRDFGLDTRSAAGLAPFTGEPIPRAVVFAFARKLGNRPQRICETLAMEIGHAYGLDHAHYCPDVMTYLSGCGRKTFRDRDVPCGERKRRACAGGKRTQNSYRHLLAVLGPRPRERR